MRRVPVSDEVLLMLAPGATYRRLLGGPLPVGWRAVVQRPALIALVIGAFVTLTNSGQLLPTLLIGSSLAWAWVPALQLLIASGLITLGSRGRLPLSSALDLFFRGHGPWSLWLLVAGAVLMTRLPEPAGGRVLPLLLSGLIAVAWTSWLVFAFCRTVLALPIWRALLGTLVYQALVWGAAYLYVGAMTFRLRPFSKFAGFLG